MINTIKNIANTENKKRLLGNFFSLSMLQIFSYILPLLTLPYLVRVLGVETFGLVSFATAFIVFFNILVDYGFNLSATREVSIYRENKDKITEIYGAVLSIKILLIFLSLLIFSFIVFTFEKFSSHIELYFITFINVIGQALFPIWYFQGMEKMKYITIINIFSKVVFTIAIFVFVHKESDYLIVPLLSGLGILIGSLYALYIIRKDFNQKFIFQSIKIMKIQFKDSSQFFLSRLSVTIYTTANIFILGLFTNNTMVGYYSIAERLYQAIQTFYNPIVQTLYPYVSKYKNIILYKKIFYLCLLSNTLGIILLFFVDEWLFGILFTNNLDNHSLQVFEILLIAAVIMVPSTLLGYSYLGALGYAKYANLSVIISSIFHMTSIAILAILGFIDIYNIAILVVITQTIDFIYRVKKIKDNNLW